MSGHEDETRIALELPSVRLRRPALASALASTRAREAALYAAAAVTYVAAGVFVTELALSWVVGFAWLLAWVCGLPALIRRFRR
jgi:hypothetical protein